MNRSPIARLILPIAALLAVALTLAAAPARPRRSAAGLPPGVKAAAARIDGARLEADVRYLADDR
ncbi:MAG: hypothetical protein ABIU54_04460, partial [Candidatus Eisenbacteria bacterium]